MFKGKLEERINTQKERKYSLKCQFLYMLTLCDICSPTVFTLYS